MTDKLDPQGNLQCYPRQPNLPVFHIIGLSLLQEAVCIENEHYFWSNLPSDYSQQFPELSHLSNYNRYRKRLLGVIEQLASLWSCQLFPYEETFLVDSILISVAHVARENSTPVCHDSIHTSQDKGYSAVIDQYYIGYKLHMLVCLNGVYRSMEMTKASVHDVYYLKVLVHSGLQDCLVLVDKGFLSDKGQLDLFCQTGIKVQTLIRRNQQAYRRCVETIFLQFCDQIMLKRNYAKTFAGMRVRIISKVVAVTLLQYINWTKDRPINHI